MILVPEDFYKLILAIVLGGLIGAEREFRDKSAGFRTIIFICLGATIFTILSIRLGSQVDPARIAASIVTGVGFLGAGTILRSSGRIRGLTTASTIWLAAALGMAIGAGEYTLALLATLVILLVLWAFPKLESWIDNLRRTRTYEVVTSLTPDRIDGLEQLIVSNGLQVTNMKRMKVQGDIICTWEVVGTPQAHENLLQALFDLPDVREVRY